MTFLRRLYFPLLLLVIAGFACRPIGGAEDFWAHAAIGRWTLENGVPTRTLFLWTADIPWVFHAYGSGVIFALLLQNGGPALAVAFNVVMSCLPFALLYLGARRAGLFDHTAPLPKALGRRDASPATESPDSGDELEAPRLAPQTTRPASGPIESRPGSGDSGWLPGAVAVLMLAAIWAASVRFRLRPEMFTVLFLSLLFLFFLLPRRRLWHHAGLVAMFALWPNLHGGVLIGFATLGVGAALEGLQKRRFDGALWTTFAVCLIVPFLSNPYGFDYARTWTGTAATAFAISEWRPFWVQPRLNMDLAVCVLGLWAVATALWALDPARRWSAIGFLTLFGLAFVQARRQLWLVALAGFWMLLLSAPLLRTTRLYRWLKRDAATLMPEPMRLIASVGAVLMLGGAAINALPDVKGGFRPISRSAPVAMSRFLLEEAPPGRLFNDYEYSASLEWFLNGRRPLYIDLINAYEADLIHEYLGIIAADEKHLPALARREVELIALRPPDSNRPGDPIRPFIRYLEAAPHWKEIYRGVDGRVWHLDESVLGLRRPASASQPGHQPPATTPS